MEGCAECAAERGGRKRGRVVLDELEDMELRGERWREGDEGLRGLVRSELRLGEERGMRKDGWGGRGCGFLLRSIRT